MISEGPSDRFGNVSVPRIGAWPAGDLKGCLVSHAPGFMHAVFEPASRFWTMQLVETGLFAGAALVLIGFAAWWTDRRA